MKVTIKDLKTAFLVGIKGVGMASLAYILDDLGLRVQGSDLPESFVTSELLKKRKFPIFTSFDPKLIEDTQPDLVITTGAHQGTQNPQFQQAKKKGILSLTHAQALGWLMNQKKIPISIAGVGGKTTISSLLSHILEENNYQPAYAVGAGSIRPLIWPGKWGRGDYFVAEADEYATCPLTDHRPRFYWQKPKLLILTNIEYDHPDIYPDLKDTLNTFLDFALKTLHRGGTVISYFDNPNNRWLINKLKKENQGRVITYGFTEGADWQINPLNLTYPQSQARVLSHEGDLISFKLSLPGRFNLANATAAAIAARHLGLNAKQIGKSLANFQSVQRRFEYLGPLNLPQNTIFLYDDYAHHPKEIKTTLEAAREWFPHRRIGVIFQPHTFSRTKRLLDEFATALPAADRIYLAPIFASAREKKEDQINWQERLKEKVKNHLGPSQKVITLNNVDDLKKELLQDEKKVDVLFTMGAGDIYKWGQKLLNSFS